MKSVVCRGFKCDCRFFSSVVVACVALHICGSSAKPENLHLGAVAQAGLLRR